MSRIYLEIRIECKTEEEKENLATILDEQSKKLLGKVDRSNYIRQVAALDAATGIINKLKSSEN